MFIQAEEWTKFARDGVREGERNAAIASLLGKMLANALPIKLADELIHAWNDARCRPPLGRKEVDSIVASISQREHRKSAPFDDVLLKRFAR